MEIRFKQKQGLEVTMNGLEKPFTKKFDQQNRKSVEIKVKLPQENKKTTSEKLKFGSNKKLGLE